MRPAGRRRCRISARLVKPAAQTPPSSTSSVNGPAGVVRVVVCRWAMLVLRRVAGLYLQNTETQETGFGAVDRGSKQPS
jgi:hypothetical protein